MEEAYLEETGGFPPSPSDEAGWNIPYTSTPIKSPSHAVGNDLEAQPLPMLIDLDSDEGEEEEEEEEEGKDTSIIQGRKQPRHPYFCSSSSSSESDSDLEACIHTPLSAAAKRRFFGDLAQAPRRARSCRRRLSFNMVPVQLVFDSFSEEDLVLLDQDSGIFSICSTDAAAAAAAAAAVVVDDDDDDDDAAAAAAAAPIIISDDEDDDDDAAAAADDEHEQSGSVHSIHISSHEESVIIISDDDDDDEEVKIVSTPKRRKLY